MSTPDPDELAQRLEREAQQMQGQSERLGQRVSETREDWERKRADPNVPGAPVPTEPGDGSASDPPEVPPHESGAATAAGEEAPELQVGPPADAGRESERPTGSD